jgi:hypothetical protein
MLDLGVLAVVWAINAICAIGALPMISADARGRKQGRRQSFPARNGLDGG